MSVNVRASVLEDVIAVGNRGHYGWEPYKVVTCADGFRMSVIAGSGTYCTPRPAMCMCRLGDKGQLATLPRVFTPLPGEVEHDYSGPYTHVEVGFPTERPEPWSAWARYVEEHDSPLNTVYAYVPVSLVRALVAAHGGEIEAQEEVL